VAAVLTLERPNNLFPFHVFIPSYFIVLPDWFRLMAFFERRGADSPARGISACYVVIGSERVQLQLTICRHREGIDPSVPRTESGCNSGSVSRKKAAFARRSIFLVTFLLTSEE